MTLIAGQSEHELGGAHSILVRQRRDHVRLDRLIVEVDRSGGRRRAEALNRLSRLVFPHAFAEESVLWPAIRRWVPQGGDLTLQIEREHQQINELFTRLERLDVDGEAHHALWARIVTLLREDVRDEEDRLLPLLQAAVPARALAVLGWTWAAVRYTAPTRAHPVVARRPPGNVAAAVPLTVTDRARDRLDTLARRHPGRAARTSAALSVGLSRLAALIEHVPPLTRGEDPSTRSGQVAESSSASGSPSGGGVA